MTWQPTPESDKLLDAFHQNRCGDPVCEGLRLAAAIKVLTGPVGNPPPPGAHNGYAVLLFAALEPNEAGTKP